MSYVDDAERKRLVRAAASYSLKSQQQLAGETGIKYGTLKGILRPGGAMPTVDQARAIATACGVPTGFVDSGWPATDDDRIATLESAQRQLEARLLVLEEEVRQRNGGRGLASGDPSP